MVVLALFLEASSGLMHTRDEILDFATALALVELAPFVFLTWVPLRFQARGYSRLPPLLGIAAGLLAVLTFFMIAVQAAAGS